VHSTRRAGFSRGSQPRGSRWKWGGHLFHKGRTFCFGKLNIHRLQLRMLRLDFSVLQQQHFSITGGHQ
jgi:hypothetical protein